MKELLFSQSVKEKLGGVSKVAEKTKQCKTRGFDLQMYLKKTYKGCNLVKVTAENDKLEVMFYNLKPGKFSLVKLNTIEIRSLDEVSDVIFNEIGLKFED